jgi:putative transposase
MLRNQFPIAVLVVGAGRDDVLAFLQLTLLHYCHIWSNNPRERLNKEINRCTNVLWIPNVASIVRMARA